MNTENPATAEKNPEGRISRMILEWIGEVVIAVIFISLLFTFVFRVITVQGVSMHPNYDDGDRVLVLANPFGVSNGDVVVIDNILDEPIIKRVIAVENQTVDFDYEAKTVIVDGVPVDETEFGLSNGITDLPYSSLEILEFPQTVPEGCVFVLGDNREVSEDSRYSAVGMIDERNILGKALLIMYPFDRIGFGN